MFIDFIDFQVAVQMKGTTRHVPAQRGRAFYPTSFSMVDGVLLASAPTPFWEMQVPLPLQCGLYVLPLLGKDNMWRDMHDIFESRGHPEI